MVLKAKDFFPIKANYQYVYEGLGNEYLSYTRFTDYTSDIKQQYRINNGGTETVNVYEYTSTGVRLIISKPEVYYRENFLDKPKDLNEYLIKDPVKVGTTWSVSGGAKVKITSINETVKTKFGTYTSVIEVMKTKNNEKELNYYAKDIGLIKTVYLIGSDTLSSEIKEIKENSPLVQSIKLFYPDKYINASWYGVKNIKFYTNDITKSKFQAEFKSPLNGLVNCIGKNTTIKSLYYNDLDKMVHIDFSSNFVSDLNAGSSYESLCLNSITNSIGYYYNSDKVYITIDGKPYSSGHIEKKVGEPFIVQPLIGAFGVKEWEISNCSYPMTYVVKAGDTLSAIAKAYCTTYKKIAEINDIANPDLIYSNQVLQICPGKIYTVKSGDTLTAIARKYGTTYKEIARVNNISNPDLIYVNQILIIPCNKGKK